MPHPPNPEPNEAETTERVERLVGDWLPVPDVAERTGASLATVRRWLDERDLLALRVGERRIRCVPAAFLDADGPLAALRGTMTVLADGGMSDLEILEWLFTPDASLPQGGSPMATLRTGGKTEIRRRAMELAL